MKKYIKQFVFYITPHIIKLAITSIDWDALIEEFTHLFYLAKREKCYAMV